jgi:hypothetical protein
MAEVTDSCYLPAAWLTSATVVSHCPRLGVHSCVEYNAALRNYEGIAVSRDGETYDDAAADAAAGAAAEQQDKGSQAKAAAAVAEDDANAGGGQGSQPPSVAPVPAKVR